MAERAKCPNLETNNNGCTCPNKDCPNHGFCCACVEVHRSAGNPPLCMRDVKK